jgi:hypothetical protein
VETTAALNPLGTLGVPSAGGVSAVLFTPLPLCVAKAANNKVKTIAIQTYRFNFNFVSPTVSSSRVLILLLDSGPINLPEYFWSPEKWLMRNMCQYYQAAFARAITGMVIPRTWNHRMTTAGSEPWTD